MKLQSDPTAIYDLSDGVGILDHSLTHDELHRSSPHNTYEIDGLPPGPICSPGLASLKLSPILLRGTCSILWLTAPADTNSRRIFESIIEV